MFNKIAISLIYHLGNIFCDFDETLSAIGDVKRTSTERERESARDRDERSNTSAFAVLSLYPTSRIEMKDVEEEK